ncbi:hypothetical protein IHO40_03315 [Wolbachia endosymbiont of Mansonella ozzardi]|uniref:hypothetical protein n=1 Tax=Wolbachia endosymbiont of Mansonella ozzardi TaxID=137464 RepID=UPI001CE1F50C|nr:hypothetical protein [Wolbachia endosymbiont of Mansonella ozzardi]MCA4775128.1 hypothetical protein [Wolbachia endosymbiont of Mansonella ozzardi]
MDCADLRNLFKEEKQQEEVLDPVALRSLFDESPSSESQPTKSETGVYFMIQNLVRKKVLEIIQLEMVKAELNGA